MVLYYLINTQFRWKQGVNNSNPLTRPIWDLTARSIWLVDYLGWTTPRWGERRVCSVDLNNKCQLWMSMKRQTVPPRKQICRRFWSSTYKSLNKYVPVFRVVGFDAADTSEGHCFDGQLYNALLLSFRSIVQLSRILCAEHIPNAPADVQVWKIWKNKDVKITLGTNETNKNIILMLLLNYMYIAFLRHGNTRCTLQWMIKILINMTH